VSTLSSSTLATIASWASTHLSAGEEGILYTLHPHLMPPRYSVALTHARPVAAAEGANPRFAATLEAFARLAGHLDELARTLPEEEQRAFTLSLLEEEDSRSLLRHLLLASAPPAAHVPVERQ
jgi:hypothetical protein